MKLKKIQKVLLCGVIAMGVLSYTSNASAATFLSKRVVIQTITTEGKDKFEVVENKYGTGKLYSGYEVSQSIINNVMYFKVITEKGTTLGLLENSAGKIDNTKDLGNGKKQYTFHYTLFDYEPVRIININVTPISTKL